MHHEGASARAQAEFRASNKASRGIWKAALITTPGE